MKLKKNQPLVSIIIRTKNEERWILRCINRIKEQNYKNYEIIIIDNYSTDNTLVKLSKYKNIKIIKIKNYFPGLAINKGIKNSNGQLCVILSAHCLPVKNTWLSSLVDTILENNNYAAVYGKQEPMEFSSNEDKRDLYLIFGLDKKIQIKDTFFHNANSIIRKEVWKKIKFDNKTPNIEDRLWAEKIIKKKYNIVYQPSANVYHYHGIHQNNNDERLSNVVKIVSNNIKTGSIDPKKTNTFAILPIRGTSSKLKKINLIELTINRLKNSKYINKIVVTSDNRQTLKLSKDLGSDIQILRPKKLSKPNVNLEEVQKYTLKELEKKGHEIDLVLHCEETYPFRDKDIFDKMIMKILSEGLDTVIISKNENNWLWSEKNNAFYRVDSGDVPRNFKEKSMIGYHGIGCLTYPEFIRNGKLLGKKIGLLEIKNPLSFIEVRSSTSIKIAEQILINSKIL